MANSLDRLAVRIARLEKELRAVSTAPQLAFSSIEDGAVAEYDQDGTLVQLIGTQYDGTHAAVSLSGPVPPTPSDPTVVPGVNALTVRWDGLFADPAVVSPMDFSRVEVHVSDVQGFDYTTADYLRGTIESPRGGELVVGPLTPGTTYYARLVVRTLSGKSSDASNEISGVPQAVTAEPPAPVAPTTVPTPAVVGTIRSLAVTWSPIAGQSVDWAEIHVSTDPAHVFVQGDATTLAATESGLSARFETDPSTGSPLEKDIDYYVAMFVGNDAGAAGPSATVGPVQLVPIDSADIAVGAAWVGTLDADNIRDGSLQADVAVVGSLTATGANGEKVQLSGDGFVVKGPPPAGATEGPVYVQFPTDGTKPDIFTGVLDASTLTVETGSNLSGTTQIAPKGTLLLGNQVADPKNAPNVTFDWESVNADQVENSREWHGLAHNTTDNTWWSMWYRSKDDTTGLTQWDANGVVLRDFTTGASRGRARGLVWHADRFYTLRNAMGEANWVDRLEVWNNDFSVQYQTLDLRVNYGIFWGTIGWDYVNGRLVYAYYNDTESSPFSNGLPQSAVALEHWSLNADLTVGAKVKTRHTLGSPNYAEGIASADFGTFDFGDGAARYVVHLRSEHTQSPNAIRDRYLIFPDTEGAAHDDNWTWYNAGGFDVCGTIWDGSNFHSIGALATRHKYEGGLNYYYGVDGNYGWFFSYSYYDGNGTTHETGLSPNNVTYPTKRTRPTVTVGTVPTGDADYPDRARVYFAREPQGTSPGPAGYALWAELFPPTTSWTMNVSGTAIGGAGPSSNTFPAVSTPGILTNPSGTVKLSGDGSGKIGSLSWDKAGSLLTDFNKPYVSEYRVNNMSVASGGSAVVVNFGTTEAWVNVAAGGIVGNGDGTYTINMPGKYVVMAQISWDSNSAGRREVSIWLNGVSEIAYTAAGGGAQNQSVNVVKAFALKTGDVIDIRAWQNSGAALNIVGGLNRTSIQIAMIAGN